MSILDMQVSTLTMAGTSLLIDMTGSTAARAWWTFSRHDWKLIQTQGILLLPPSHTPDTKLQSHTSGMKLLQHTPDMKLQPYTSDMKLLEHTPGMKLQPHTLNMNLQDTSSDMKLLQHTPDMNLLYQTPDLKRLHQTSVIKHLPQTSDMKLPPHTPDMKLVHNTPDMKLLSHNSNLKLLSTTEATHVPTTMPTAREATEIPDAIPDLEIETSTIMQQTISAQEAIVENASDNIVVANYEQNGEDRETERLSSAIAEGDRGIVRQSNAVVEGDDDIERLSTISAVDNTAEIEEEDNKSLGKHNFKEIFFLFLDILVKMKRLLRIFFLITNPYPDLDPDPTFPNLWIWIRLRNHILI
jgi:hypothetical protein